MLVAEPPRGDRSERRARQLNWAPRGRYDPNRLTRRRSSAEAVRELSSSVLRIGMILLAASAAVSPAGRAELRLLPPPVAADRAGRRRRPTFPGRPARRRRTRPQPSSSGSTGSRSSCARRTAASRSWRTLSAGWRMRSRNSGRTSNSALAIVRARRSRPAAAAVASAPSGSRRRPARRDRRFGPAEAPPVRRLRPQRHAERPWRSPAARNDGAERSARPSRAVGAACRRAARPSATLRRRPRPVRHRRLRRGDAGRPPRPVQRRAPGLPGRRSTNRPRTGSRRSWPPIPATV